MQNYNFNSQHFLLMSTIFNYIITFPFNDISALLSRSQAFNCSCFDVLFCIEFWFFDNASA